MLEEGSNLSDLTQVLQEQLRWRQQMRKSMIKNFFSVEYSLSFTSEKENDNILSLMGHQKSLDWCYSMPRKKHCQLSKKIPYLGGCKSTFEFTWYSFMGHFSPFRKHIITVTQGNIHGNFCIFSCERKDGQFINDFRKKLGKHSKIFTCSSMESTKQKRCYYQTQTKDWSHSTKV